MENALDKLEAITEKMAGERLAANAAAINACLTGESVLMVRDDGQAEAIPLSLFYVTPPSDPTPQPR
jgi:hypothetical protein